MKQAALAANGLAAMNVHYIKAGMYGVRSVSQTALLLESIARESNLVREAHACQAGREVRVIVDAKKVDDATAYTIAPPRSLRPGYGWRSALHGDR